MMELAEGGLANEAEDALYEMIDAGVKPGPLHFGAIIASCAQAADTQRAERWLFRMKALEVQPEAGIFHELMHVAAEAGNPAAAEQWMNDAWQEGFEPDLQTFKYILRSLRKAQDTVQLETWFERLMQMKLQPDMECVNEIIGAFADQENLDKAVEWTAIAKRLGLSPDVQTYKLLIASYLKLGLLQEAEGVIEEIAQPSADVFVLLIGDGRTYREPQMVQRWAQRLLDAGIDIDSLGLRLALVDSWEASSTIRRRFKGDKAWLLLPPSKDPEQDEMERPMSTRSLAFNSSAVAALIRRFAPRKLKVRMLLGPIKGLYQVMGAQADRRQTYVDAWVLRRLYTYARRRQQDDEAVREIFQLLRDFGHGPLREDECDEGDTDEDGESGESESEEKEIEVVDSHEEGSMENVRFMGAELKELEGKSEADLRRLGALALAEDAKKQAEANEGAPQQSEEEQLQAELDRLLVELQMAERLVHQMEWLVLMLPVVLARSRAASRLKVETQAYVVTADGSAARTPSPAQKPELVETPEKARFPEERLRAWIV
ncbi:unnamed protein product [Effrenium voratum]|uniref:Pentatricopeptide repeat-containing protein n=1 Tax=Effrenium voratum TaxID=2562239 RepID=A0AA36J727_9DINO|nr:unnamed protein product [Effrenium voratum]